MQKIGFMLKVRPEKLGGRLRLAQPDLAAALKDAGMRNYSLWLAPEGTEFGYLECDDWAAVCAKLDNSEVHTRWQTLMQDFLLTPIASGDGGQPVMMLEKTSGLTQVLFPVPGFVRAILQTRSAAQVPGRPRATLENEGAPLRDELPNPPCDLWRQTRPQNGDLSFFARLAWHRPLPA